MSRETRPGGTYLRIIESSLQLFNEQGERNVSTNHIANHLGISPGNLYYHFGNKDEIVVQLFKRYSEELQTYLTQNELPDNIAKMTTYMAGVYRVLWAYRFLFSDVNALLMRNRTAGQTQRIHARTCSTADYQAAAEIERKRHYRN